MRTHAQKLQQTGFLLVSITMAIFMSVPVLAGQQGMQDQQQSRSQSQSPSQNQQAKQGQQSQFQSSSRQQAGQQQSQQAADRQWQLDPMGWVTVGYDYDNDGSFDTFETITYYDLQRQRAQRQQGMMGSQQGMMSRHQDMMSRQQGMMGQQGQQQGMMSRQGEQQGITGQQRLARQAQQQKMVQGRIQSLQTVSIANTDQQHVIAKVSTPRGTIAKVDLGPQPQISGINLQQGNQIRVMGTKGTINDRAMLIADQLQTNGRHISIERRGSKELQRFQATVLNTRTLSDQQQTNLMARVRLQNGRTTIVNLGPAGQLPNLSQGQQIQMLARVTQIQGKNALIAERLRTQGQTYRINWEKVQQRSPQAG